ncbi:MAG TPA: Rho termination factor N-terminal domain-containing protein [Actinomycetota bacterium]|nr:Rho termination factor N-terminal domain-containing protein [Actinomycetota bacterium]HEX5902650.1 Rho termination factor N-terminal domain-containing protein [Actinomycetota bacterium]
MATRKQTQASRRNIGAAQRAARSKRTIANLPKSTRRELGRQAARGRARSGKAGRALEDRNRQQLYDTAKKMDIPGRSRMGKWELIEAIRRKR